MEKQAILKKNCFSKLVVGLACIIIGIFNAKAQDAQHVWKPLKDYAIKVAYSIKSGALVTDFEMFISEQGTVYLLNKDYYADFKPKVTLKTGQLSSEDFLALKEAIIKADLFRLNNEYIASPKHLGYRGEILTVTLDGKTKQILCGASSLPLELSRLILKIKEIREIINSL